MGFFATVQTDMQETVSLFIQSAPSEINLNELIVFNCLIGYWSHFHKVLWLV